MTAKKAIATFTRFAPVVQASLICLKPWIFFAASQTFTRLVA